MSWERARDVLCVRLDSIGDVLMTSPAIRALRAPGRRLTLLTSSTARELGLLLPDVDDVIVYDPPWMKHPARDGNARIDRAMVDRLRRRRFDAAVIFTVYTQTPLPAAMLCFLADIPLRLAHCRDKPYGLLTHHVPDPEPEEGIRHEVRRQLDLVAEVGAVADDPRLSLRIPRSAGVRAMRALAAAGLDLTRPWAVVHPGATAPSRRYPSERFAEVVRTLTDELGIQVAVTGTVPESDLVEKVAARRGIPLAGRLSLPELAAVIQAAPVLVTNNSGPAHVAAAVSTPVVVIYALTNPQHTPWMVTSRVLFRDVACRNCQSSVCTMGHQACIAEVAPAEVVEAAVELLQPAPGVTPVL